MSQPTKKKKYYAKKKESPPKGAYAKKGSKTETVKRKLF
jgi:hypothetical protein